MQSQSAFCCANCCRLEGQTSGCVFLGVCRHRSKTMQCVCDKEQVRKLPKNTKEKSCQINRSHGFTIFPMHSASVCSMPWELRYFTADSCSDVRICGQDSIYTDPLPTFHFLSACVGVNFAQRVLCFLPFHFPPLMLLLKKIIECVHPLTSSYFKYGSVLS